MNPIVLALYIPAFLYADRAWGSEEGGRKVGILMSLAAAAAGWFTAGPTVAILALAWPVYRSLGFAAGSMAPLTNGQRVKALIRHLPTVPAGLLAAYWGETSLVVAGFAMAAFSLAATALACWYGDEVSDAMDAGVPIGDQNATVERARGACYGAAMFAVALLGGAGLP